VEEREVGGGAPEIADQHGGGAIEAAGETVAGGLGLQRGQQPAETGLGIGAAEARFAVGVVG
jgi:hypothetical protein